MKSDDLIAHLEKVVAQLGIELRYEKGDFRGGICRIGERRIFILNQTLPPAQKIAVLAGELAGLDLSGIYIMPAVRQIIEQAAKDRQNLEA